MLCSHIHRLMISNLSARPSRPAKMYAVIFESRNTLPCFTIDIGSLQGMASRNQEYLRHQPKYTASQRYQQHDNAFLPPLSAIETIRLHLHFFVSGLSSSLRLESMISALAMSPVARSNVVNSSLLQVVLLVSSSVLDPMLVRTIGGRHETGRASLMFHVLFLYPLVLASVYYSGLFNVRVTSSANERRPVAAGMVDRGMATTIVKESYRVVVLLNYVLAAYTLRLIPYLPLAFIFCCLGNAYYLFEGQWIKQGWTLTERIRYLESRWAFFLGFGLPITLMSYFFTNPLISLSIFSLIYSPSLLLTITAHVEPVDPLLPSTTALKLSFLPQSAGSSISIAAAEGGEEMRGRRGHFLVPVRIRVLFLAEMISRGLETMLVGGNTAGRKKKDAGAPSYGGSGSQDVPGWRGDTGRRQDSAQLLQRQQQQPHDYQQKQNTPQQQQQSYQQQSSSSYSSPRHSYQNPPRSHAQDQQQPVQLQHSTSSIAAPSTYSAPAAFLPAPFTPSSSSAARTTEYSQATSPVAASSNYVNPLASMMGGSPKATTRRTHQASESSVGVAVARSGSGFDTRGSPLNGRGKGE